MTDFLIQPDNPSPTVNHYSAHPLRCLRPLFLHFSLFLLFAISAARAATLTGNVSNVATRNLLEGARVEVPALGLTALTDNTGRYVFPSLPAGTHEVVVTYVGLDAARTTGSRWLEVAFGGTRCPDGRSGSTACPGFDVPRTGPARAAALARVTWLRGLPWPRD